VRQTASRRQHSHHTRLTGGRRHRGENLKGPTNVIPLVPGSTERLRGEIRTRSEGLLLAGGVGSRIFRSRMPL
jgi:hypothetical protein